MDDLNNTDNKPVPKRIKTDDLNSFLEWCNKMNIYINYNKVFYL